MHFPAPTLRLECSGLPGATARRRTWPRKALPGRARRSRPQPGLKSALKLREPIRSSTRWWSDRPTSRATAEALSGEAEADREPLQEGHRLNLAIHLISDAAEHELDAAMAITDDFDQAGALRMAKELYGISLIVVSPRRQRKLAKSVGADFYKPLHESLLRECQLPDMAIDHNGHEVHRPATWIETPKMERPPRGTASSLAPEATRACSAKISPTADAILRHRNRLRSVNPARLRSDIDWLFR